MTTVGAPQVSIIGAVWRNRYLVAGFVIGGAIVMWLFALLIPGSATSEATASVVVSDASEFAVGAAEQPERFVGNQVEILRSLRVANRTLDLLEQNGFSGVARADLLDDLRVLASDNSDEIVIRYSDADPALAIATVNSVLEAYVEINKEQSDVTAQEALSRIDAEIDVLAERLDTITAQIAEAESSEVIVDSLAAGAAEAASTITALQAQLDGTVSADERAALLARVGELRARIELYLAARSAAVTDPAVQALLESQNRAIERRATLVERRDQILIDTALTPGVVVFQDPAVATEPVPGFSGLRAVAAGLVLGLVAGSAYATIRVSRRGTVTGRSQVADLLGAPVLASVPDFKAERLLTPIPVVDSPSSAVAESYRFAASSLETALARLEAKTVMVASPSIGQGKTTTLANVSAASALQGSRVLAIDADFEDQALARLLLDESSLGDIVGISDAVTERGVELADAVWTTSVGVEGLFMMSRGSQRISSSEILQSSEPRFLISEAEKEFDLVLIDSPPLLRVAYASDLMKLVDAVVAVIPRWCSIEEVIEFRDRCDFLNVPIAGFVFTHDSLTADLTRGEEPSRGIFSRDREPQLSPTGATD